MEYFLTFSRDENFSKSFNESFNENFTTSNLLVNINNDSNTMHGHAWKFSKCSFNATHAKITVYFVLFYKQLFAEIYIMSGWWCYWCIACSIHWRLVRSCGIYVCCLVFRRLSAHYLLFVVLQFNPIGIFRILHIWMNEWMNEFIVPWEENIS